MDWHELLDKSVVFLDVDGVLHSLFGDDLFVEGCCRALEHVLRATGAHTVLSSSWRSEESKVAMLNGVLQRRQLAPVMDRTPELGAPREAEICTWLDQHPEVTRWIAIDDMDLESSDTVHARRMRGRFVRTDCNTGLTHAQAERAIQLLQAQAYCSGSPFQACRARLAPTPARQAAALGASVAMRYNMAAGNALASAPLGPAPARVPGCGGAEGNVKHLPTVIAAPARVVVSASRKDMPPRAARPTSIVRRAETPDSEAGIAAQQARRVHTPQRTPTPQTVAAANSGNRGIPLDRGASPKVQVVQRQTQIGSLSPSAYGRCIHKVVQSVGPGGVLTPKKSGRGDEDQMTSPVVQTRRVGSCTAPCHSNASASSSAPVPPRFCSSPATPIVGAMVVNPASGPGAGAVHVATSAALRREPSRAHSDTAATMSVCRVSPAPRVASHPLPPCGAAGMGKLASRANGACGKGPAASTATLTQAVFDRGAGTVRTTRTRSPANPSQLPLAAAPQLMSKGGRSDSCGPRHVASPSRFRAVPAAAPAPVGALVGGRPPLAPGGGAQGASPVSGVVRPAAAQHSSQQPQSSSPFQQTRLAHRSLSPQYVQTISARAAEWQPGSHSLAVY